MIRFVFPIAITVATLHSGICIAIEKSPIESTRSTNLTMRAGISSTTSSFHQGVSDTSLQLFGANDRKTSVNFEMQSNRGSELGMILGFRGVPADESSLQSLGGYFGARYQPSQLAYSAFKPYTSGSVSINEYRVASTNNGILAIQSNVIGLGLALGIESAITEQISADLNLHFENGVYSSRNMIFRPQTIATMLGMTVGL